MTQNDEKSQAAQAALCPKCNDMFGHPSFDHLCSACYKKEKNIQEALQTPKLTRHPHLHDELPFPEQPLESIPALELPREDAQPQLPSGKCTRCSKKTGLLGFSCKHCAAEFCRAHRLPEDHACSADFIELGRKRIKTENPVVASKKIADI